MKLKIMLIGIALVLMLCISPVAAVSGSDFEIVIETSDHLDTCKYLNPVYKVHPNCPNSPGEKYIHIYTGGTHWLNSITTFKPADIPDAPTMVVNTYGPADIRLPYYSVDKWEIKYYSSTIKITQPDDKYLKNAGTVDVKEVFGQYLPRGLELWLSSQQLLCTKNSYYNDKGMVEKPAWKIPDVD